MTYEAVKEAFTKLFLNEMAFDDARDLLSTLHHEGEGIEEIAAATEVMREFATKLPIKEELQDRLVDIVGTGGDRSFSFNISTTTALLLASAGEHIAKHGNRSVTSQSGSADVLEALGISLDLSLADQVKLLEETGFVFAFAQKHHPAFKHIMPVRKSLSHPTIFNILGPLTNPAGVRRQFIGIFNPIYLKNLATALQKTGSITAAVACGDGNMDELTLSGPSKVAELKDDQVVEYEICPESLGLEKAPLAALRGADSKVNARITYSIFDGSSTKPQKEVILLNAAMALKIAGRARDMQEGIEIARDAIDSGKALAKLKEIVKVSSSL